MIYFLIPVYNEALNIEELACTLKSAVPEYNKFYLFVDDCSTDDTQNLICKYLLNEDFHIIKKAKNYGPGDSFNLGFEWILNQSKHEDDLVISLEADNTSDLSILQKMIKISELDYDLVLASVYAQGGGFERTTLFRRFVSFNVNMLLRLIFDIKILTLSSFYRLYKIELLKSIKAKYPNIIIEKGFVSMLEILLKAIKLNASIIEVPMTLHSTRRKGKSKMKTLRTSLSYINFLLNNKV
jgi:dolichol-phosphate mannosyltransferase